MLKPTSKESVAEQKAGNEEGMEDALTAVERGKEIDTDTVFQTHTVANDLKRVLCRLCY